MVAKNWRKFVATKVNSNWFCNIFNHINSKNFPKNVLLDFVDYFLQLDFGPIYKEVVETSKQKKKSFGLLPLMM